MAVRLVWTPAARRDFKAVYVELARVNPAAAERYASDMRSKILRLMEYPHLGSRRSEIFPSARLLVVAPFVILYETVPHLGDGEVAIVEIVRIVDGRRDLPSLF